MALNMEKKTVSGERLAGTARVQVPLRSESASTGVREAAEVLWEDARLYISGAEAHDGSVRVEGTLYCQALYRLEGDSAIKTAQSETAIGEEIEMDAARRGMAATAWGEVEHLEAEYVGGRVVFSAALELGCEATEDFEAQVVQSAAGEGLEVKISRFPLRRATGEARERVTLRDEVSLPSALRARGVLLSRCAVRGVVCQREEGGLRVGGEVLLEALVRCGVEERPLAMVKYAMPFEQALPLPQDAPGEPAAQAQVKALACQLDDEEPEDAAIRVSCEVDVSARIYDTREAACVTDAYGTADTDYAVKTEPLSLSSGINEAQGRSDFRGEILLGDGAGVGAVLAARVQPCVSEAEGDAVRGVVESVCLYVPAGREQVACARGESPFEIRLDQPLPENARLRVEAADADAVSVVTGRLEVRASLTAKASWRQETALPAAADLIPSPAAPRPSAIRIRYAQRGETLWDIARLCRVREEDLRRLNPGMEQPEDGSPVIVWA